METMFSIIKSMIKKMGLQVFKNLFIHFIQSGFKQNDYVDKRFLVFLKISKHFYTKGQFRCLKRKEKGYEYCSQKS